MQKTKRLNVTREGVQEDLNMNDHVISNASYPVNPHYAVNKWYVDDLVLHGPARNTSWNKFERKQDISYTQQPDIQLGFLNL